MQGAIVAALILLSGTTGHVEGAETDRWGSDQVSLRRRQEGADDQHGQPARLTDNIDLGARARAAHRSGKCELLLVSNASVVSFVKVPVFGS